MAAQPGSLKTRESIVGKKHFPVLSCEEAFRFSSSLKTHFRIYSDERPSSCPHCTKDFGQLSHLQAHIRIHNGEKQHRYPHCPKSFSLKNVLGQHPKTHAGDRCLSCFHCSLLFATASELTDQPWQDMSHFGHEIAARLTQNTDCHGNVFFFSQSRLQVI